MSYAQHAACAQEIAFHLDNHAGSRYTTGISVNEHIQQLDHVALQVADLDRSCAFYGSVLALEPMERPAFNFPGAWFRLGERQELHLIVRDGVEVIPAQDANHYALRVDDIGACVRHLETHNVTIRGPRPRPDGIMQMYVEDPDGHTIEICCG